MKKFKKHKFIPMELLAKLFGVDELNMRFFRSAWEKRNSYLINLEDMYRVGYGQYAIVDNGDIKFDILSKRKEGDKLSELYYNMNLNLLCKDLFTLEQMQGYKGYTKFKPIYKIYDKKDRTPLNYEGYAMPAGVYYAELIGILIK